MRSVDAGDTAVPCSTDAECWRDFCVAGRCVPAQPCADGTACGYLESCVPICLPRASRCDGVTCPPHQACRGGVCMPECVPPLIEDVAQCPAGTAFDPTLLRCVDAEDCAGVCAFGEVCVRRCAQWDPCSFVLCRPDEVCSYGECLPAVSPVDCDRPCDPLADAGCVPRSCTPRCPADVVCGASDGCGGVCAGRCPARHVCLGGRCQCLPYCPRDAHCGDSNGCGGTCNGGGCDGGGCVNGQCCMPRCARNARCGDWDGCQGFCQGPCPPGQWCSEGSCRGQPIEDPPDACIPSCPPRDVAQCGASDGCGGWCDGRCAAGSDCVRGTCVADVPCVPSCPEDGECGGPDGCGGLCAQGRCPEGQACARDGCRCAPDCAGRVCGQPDGCGGTCLGGCAAGYVCRQGVCSRERIIRAGACPCGSVRRNGVCVPECADGRPVCGCWQCCASWAACREGHCRGAPG